MPVHLNSWGIEGKDTKYFAAILYKSGDDQVDFACVDKSKRYLHWGQYYTDELTGQRVGKYVYTAEILEDRISILDVDITILNKNHIELHFDKKLKKSSDSNEYYEVISPDMDQHFEIETVNRYMIEGEIEGSKQEVSCSAFPFSLTVFDDMDAFDRFIGFDKEKEIGNTGLKMGGLSEHFTAPGSIWGKEGENYSFIVGRVLSFKDIEVKLGDNIVNLVIAELDTGAGVLPTVMNRDWFDLRNLAVGKYIGMNADIKADFDITNEG